MKIYVAGFESDVMEKLTKLEKKVVSQGQLLSNISTFLQDKSFTSNNITTLNFSQKYKITLPINENNIFIQLDNLIDSNQLLKIDLILLLNIYLDKDLGVSKSIVNMLKTFITKNVAMIYCFKIIFWKQ